MNPSLPTNNTSYTVTELTREIRGLLESNFPQISLRGEISNLRQQQSGHIYFSLKDSGASIACVCFRGDAARLQAKLRDGMQIVGAGRVAVYEPRGNYQVIFRTIEEDGLGRLQQAFLQLKEKLQNEGLFDKERKQPLPKLARVIGFVTSETGAALADFISILQRRNWSGRLIVIPARVQGQGAAAEIERGIALANENQLCELLVVGRGGGSLEDLWPFNEERVARAVAASTIPVISAVGHEIDFTLTDFTADLRAETPSAAAEWITSAQMAFMERTEALNLRFNHVLTRTLERKHHAFSLAESSLRSQHPRNRLQQAALRLDDLQSRLGQSLLLRLRDSHQRVQLSAGRLASLRPEHHLELCREQLRQLRLRLASNSHQGTLKRGFALLRSKGKIIGEASSLPDGATFEVELRDGTFKATRSNGA